MKLGNDTFATTSKYAVLDSGTSLIAGPTKDVAALAEKVGAKKLMKEYTIDCNADAPSISFQFTGSDKVFTLEKKD